jgi:hypothetical protein
MTTPSANDRPSNPTEGKPRRRRAPFPDSTPTTSTPPPQRRRRPHAPPPPPSTELHPFPVARAILGLGERSFRRLVAEGRIAVVEVSPRKRYVRQSEIDAFLERATKPATK